MTLGATVLRTDVAAATSLAQSVFVDNTTADLVPVVEQNLDTNNGAIRYVNGSTGGCFLDTAEARRRRTGYYFPIQPVGGGLSGGIINETVDLNAAGGAQITNEGPCRLTLSGWLVP